MISMGYLCLSKTKGQFLVDQNGEWLIDIEDQQDIKITMVNDLGKTVIEYDFGLKLVLVK